MTPPRDSEGLMGGSRAAQSPQDVSGESYDFDVRNFLSRAVAGRPGVPLGDLETPLKILLDHVKDQMSGEARERNHRRSLVDLIVTGAAGSAIGAVITAVILAHKWVVLS